MITPPVRQTIFSRRQAILETYKGNKPSTQIYRTQMHATHAERNIVCDRCTDDSAPIVGVVVMPEADTAHFYCNRCYARTPMLRRVHPEWRYFDVTGGLSIEELAAALDSEGLLALNP